VVALVLVWLFLPARKVSIEPYGILSFETTVTISVGSEVAYAAPDYEYKKPTAFTDPGTKWNNEGKAYDVATPDDTTTAADSNTNPGDIDPWITFHTWDTKVQTYTATDLFVNWKTNGAYSDDIWGIQYTKNGGTNWYDLVAMGVHNETAMAQSSIALDADQDLTQVQVKLLYDKQTGGDTGVTYIYDIWTRGTYTPPDISNTPNSYNFGTVAESSATETGLTHFTVTNNSAFDVNITISGTDMEGGVTWVLSDTATPGINIYGLKAGRAVESYNIIVKKSSPNYLVENLAGSGGTQQWGLQLLAPSTMSDGETKSGTVTLTATSV